MVEAGLAQLKLSQICRETLRSYARCWIILSRGGSGFSRQRQPSTVLANVCCEWKREAGFLISEKQTGDSMGEEKLDNSEKQTGVTMGEEKLDDSGHLIREKKAEEKIGEEMPDTSFDFTRPDVDTGDCCPCVGEIAKLNEENVAHRNLDNVDGNAKNIDGNSNDRPAALHEHEKPLSKNAQKKLVKMERYKAQKLERKAYEKEKRHQETERKRKEWEAKFASLSTAEQEKALEEKMEVRKARKEKRFNRKDKLRQAMETGQNLVLDLEFCDRMKPNELVSLVQQVMYSYAANAKAAVPVRFSLTGCNGEIQAQLARVSGFCNWLIHKEERSYLEVFEERKGDLVYLTADSDNVLDQLEDSKIYIVGGLVDRNRWKGLTFEKAKSQGILTAKLPITDHLKMTSSPVLTVNQVVEIILSFLELKDWEKALLQVIPQRKRSAEDDLDETEQKDSEILGHQAEIIEHDAGVQHSCDVRTDQSDGKLVRMDQSDGKLRFGEADTNVRNVAEHAV